MARTTTTRTTRTRTTIMVTATTAVRRRKARRSCWVRSIALAIPSVIIGAITFEPLLFGGGFGESIFFSAEHHEALHEIGASVGNWLALRAARGREPGVLADARRRVLRLGAVHQVAAPAGRHRFEAQAAALVLENKYYFDWFNENVLARGSRLLGKIFWKGGDQVIIDGVGRWLGEHDRLHRRHRAPRADRLPLFLCVLDGHRTRRHARLVRDARLI